MWSPRIRIASFVSSPKSSNSLSKTFTSSTPRFFSQIASKSSQTGAASSSLLSFSFQRSPLKWSSNNIKAISPIFNFKRNFSSESQKNEKNSSSSSNQSPENPPTEKIQAPVSWKSLLLATMIGGAIIAYYLKLKHDKDEEIRKKTNQMFGTARIGGPFSLVDHNGKPVTNLEWKGLFQFIYFGFTNCPDICPTELTKMSNVLNTLDKEGLGDLVQPLFITIDPYRDTIASVREYLKEFHPRMVGLTGTPAQIEQLCKLYRVYHSKPKTGEDEDDYLVDHSIILYLIDPNGKFLDFYGTNLEEEDVTNRIRKHIQTRIDEIKNQGKKTN